MNLPIIDTASDTNDGMLFPAESFELIARLLKNLKGFNLDTYKNKCIKRRISIRIRATGCAGAEDYCDYLLHNEGEIDRLLKVLTIHVSHFFRNPQTFEKLKQETIPYLFSLCASQQRPQIRCWSVGCSSGEEPYSLALLFKEHYAPQMAITPVGILATDVDAAVLELARRGEYPEERLSEVPEQARRRWFSGSGATVRLDPEIKAMVEFCQGDLIATEKFPASDLILCRNVLIYFERDQQEKIIRGFADVLGAGGILVLGKSETLVGQSRQRFRTICPTERIYQVI